MAGAQNNACFNRIGIQMLIIMTPEDTGRLINGPNSEWFQFNDDEWTTVCIKFKDLIGRHTQIMDWIAKEISTNVYAGTYDTKIFPTQEEIDEKLKEIDDWVNAGWINAGKSIFKKENTREKERKECEEKAKEPILQATGYIFCFCATADALKFKMVWG